MINMKVTDAAKLLGINPASQQLTDAMFHGLSIDTRTLKAGNLFIAIPGTRVDGHDYLDEAAQKGATCALVSRKVNSALTQIIVNDVVIALGKLAQTWRNQFALLPVVAITGSNGKTTLKAMITSILIAACRGNSEQVLSSLGTFNNHLGLPLTLARINQQHRYAVIEMGMNHFGEIAYLTKLTQPHVAVITNASASHLAGVGDIAGVARAKAEVFQGLSHQGTAILNRDDGFFSFWREQIGHRNLITFGLHEDADVRALIKQDPDANNTNNANHINHTNKELHLSRKIHLQTQKGSMVVNMPLLGKHNVLNALAATAAALALDIDLLHIKTGLENLTPVPGRLQLHELENDVNIIDDTYNANPVSVRAAIDALTTFGGKKILVLGDMKELGEGAKMLHQTAGKEIRESGIDYLFTYGELSAHAAQAFGEGGFHFCDQEKLINALKPLLCKQTTILIKGSRTTHMENVVKELIG